MVTDHRTAQPQMPDAAEERARLLRHLVVEAGLEVLDRDGLGLRADSITYAKVFAYLEEVHGIRVTRGSVHDRIWPCQEDFRQEVLTIAAAHTALYEQSHGMRDAVIRILEAIDHRGLTGRDRVRAFCRVTGLALLTTYLESEGFRHFQMIKAAARVADDERSAALLQAMVKEKADGNHDERLRQFGFMFDALGLRPRRELRLDRRQSIDLFMILVQVLVTGAHLDHSAGFPTAAAKAETGLEIGDESWPWTYFGFGFLAFLELLFELDPDATLDDYEYPPAEPRAEPPQAGWPGEVTALDLDRPRRSRDELRRLVVAAGVELLLRDGLGLKAESLTYASVFAHIKQTRGINVHRSTVHPEVWASQEEFRAEILAEAARYGTEESLLTMRQAMAAQTVTRDAAGNVNVAQLILDNTRATMSAQVNQSLVSPTFSRWQSIKAAMLTGAADANLDVVRQAVNDRYEEMLTVFADTYRSVLPLVGLGVNPELRMSEEQAYHILAVLCAGLSTGAEYNIAAGAELAATAVALPRCDGSGRTDDWPIPAVGARAVLELLFVPDGSR